MPLSQSAALRPGAVRRCAGAVRRTCGPAARAAPSAVAAAGFRSRSAATLGLQARPRPGAFVSRRRLACRTTASAADAGVAALPAAERCTFRLGDSEIVLETGRVGRQAGGAILASECDTVILTTICASDEPPKDSSFLPLTVVYQERFSAAGRTASGFIKRDGKQRESEILVSRLVDRPLRPVFSVRREARGTAHRTTLSLRRRAAGRVLH